jgi:hypothetical protein
MLDKDGFVLALSSSPVMRLNFPAPFTLLPCLADAPHDCRDTDYRNGDAESWRVRAVVFPPCGWLVDLASAEVTWTTS